MAMIWSGCNFQVKASSPDGIINRHWIVHAQDANTVGTIVRNNVLWFKHAWLRLKRSLFNKKKQIQASHLVHTRFVNIQMAIYPWYMMNHSHVGRPLPRSYLTAGMVLWMPPEKENHARQWCKTQCNLITGWKNNMCVGNCVWLEHNLLPEGIIFSSNAPKWANQRLQTIRVDCRLNLNDWHPRNNFCHWNGQISTHSDWSRSNHFYKPSQELYTGFMLCCVFVVVKLFEIDPWPNTHRILDI